MIKMNILVLNVGSSSVKFSIFKEKQAMEEEKKRRIEDQLRLLVAEADLKKGDKRPVKRAISGIKVIRRRKGHPDRLIA